MNELNTVHFTNLKDLLTALAKSMNLISKETAYHHEQTAYLSYQIATAMNLSEDKKRMVIYTALLHDIGAVAGKAPQSINELERDRFRIARVGSEMLKDLNLVRDLSDAVEMAQLSWQDLLRLGIRARDLRIIPAIVHVADTISAMVDLDRPILNQIPLFREFISCQKGTEFPEEVVNGFLSCTKYEYLWMDLVQNPEYLSYFAGNIKEVSLEETVKMTRLMSRIIDFRSPFTAMHSAGVAASASSLAEVMGMSDDQCQMMLVAGNLHDIGKLKVPREILEKPGKLTEEEFNIIKEHPYYTRDILMHVSGFDDIADWAGLHHEKLNGKGYPFHLDHTSLSLGCRIMAVADVFSAIAEERPYRKPMTKEQTIAILRENAERNELSKPVVERLIENYEYVDANRDRYSREAGRHYFETLNEGEQSS